ncbi:MAG: cytochrome c3 family protein [Bryobacterales bacterium]
MKPLLAWALALICTALAWGQPAASQDTCLECHALLEGSLARPAEAFVDDIHRQSAVTCAGCHGGDPSSADPEISMSPAKGFRGKISRQDTPAMCARCHSDAEMIRRFKPQQRVDQFAQYRTSVHGQKLAAGDLKVANCVDCHSVHDIREVRHALSPVHPLRLPQTCARCHADAEHMEGYGIPTDQFAKYERSVHWHAVSVRRDLSAPTCATCHGNHGATPPGVTSVENVCGNCHVVFQRLFDESPHKAAFESMGMAACIVCHSNHEIVQPTVSMLGVAEGAVCVDCHSEGETAYAVAAGMREQLDKLSGALDNAEGILEKAEQSGMEVSQGQIEMAAAHEAWIKARVQVHAFRLDAVEQDASEGLKLAQTSYETGQHALEERDFRRTGLAFSLLTIVLTMAGLWLAVRQIESGKSRAGPG